MKTTNNSSRNLFLLIAIFIFTSATSFAHFGSKGPFGGTVSCSMVYDTTVYIGTTEGGVYMSPNSKLLSWTARPVGLKSGKITALAHSGSYLFAGTADSGTFIFTGFVGSDRYWKKINTGLTNLKIKSLVAVDSITVLVGTEGGGLFKTINKGATWTAVNNASLNTATITGMVKAQNRIVLITLAGGVFKSDDKGDTWTDFNDVNTLNIAGSSALSYNTVTDELLIANTNGLFKAATASIASTAVYTAFQTGLPANTAVHSISNNGTDWYLATNKGVFTTGTSILNWVTANTGLLTMDVNTVVPFQTRLVAGTNKEGIFKTPATGVSWVSVNTGYNNLATYSMITNGVAVVIAATEKGVFVSKDLAATYKRANNGLTDSLNVTDLTFFGSNLFATTKNAGVFVSTDTGKTWNTFNIGLTNMDVRKLFSSASNVYVFCSNGNVYQSSGIGSWTMIQSGLPGGIVPTSLTFYGTTMILSSYGTGVYTRDESGSNWLSANNGLTNLNTTSVTANTTNIFVGTDAGVFVSNPSAISWTATANTNTAIPHTALMGLNGAKIEAMAYYAGYVFASYKGGLLATSDNGITWIAGGNQFNLPSYTHVSKISFVTTRVFVTTDNNCLYSNALSELPPVGIMETSAQQNNITVYPNPSKGSFTVEMKNNNEKIQTISLYDVTGKLVKQIESKNFTGSVNMSASSGIYFIRINTDKGLTTQKIIIE